MAANRIDFFVIGVMKGGTTSLHHYLKRHPALFLPADKEAPFFALDSYYEQGVERYLRERFSGARADQRVGEVSPLYMADPRVPERLHREYPNARLIAVLRDPIDRARSHYRMMWRAFGERQPFDEVIGQQLESAELARFRAAPDAHGRREASDAYSKYQRAYVVRGEYGRILQHFLSYYLRRELLIVYSQDLERDPSRSMAGIYRFLGVSDLPVAGSDDRYHVGAQAGQNPIVRALAQAAAYRLPLIRPVAKKLVPPSYRRRLKTWSVMNRAGGPGAEAVRDVLTPETERRLARHYLKDAAILAGIADSPLPWEQRLRALAGTA